MQTLKQLSLATRLHIARKAAHKAGDILMAHYGRELTVQTKSSQVDLVTHVDLESDERIREILSEECPGETIFTEETFTADHTVTLESAWIVDPLDGTTNYAHGFPQFAVSIAYVEGGQIQLGVIFDPFKNELFTAIKDGEALRNGLPIRVSETPQLEKALLATGFPYHRQTDDPLNSSIALHDRFLRRTHGIRRAGAAALDLAYVACGRLDGFWELHLAPWDVAAGILILERAGGKVSGFHGEPIDLTHHKIDIAGSNGLLQDQMLAVINP